MRHELNPCSRLRRRGDATASARLASGPGRPRALARPAAARRARRPGNRGGGHRAAGVVEQPASVAHVLQAGETAAALLGDCWPEVLDRGIREDVGLASVVVRRAGQPDPATLGSTFVSIASTAPRPRRRVPGWRRRSGRRKPCRARAPGRRRSRPTRSIGRASRRPESRAMPLRTRIRMTLRAS